MLEKEDNHHKRRAAEMRREYSVNSKSFPILLFLMMINYLYQQRADGSESLLPFLCLLYIPTERSTGGSNR